MPENKCGCFFLKTVYTRSIYTRTVVSRTKNPVSSLLYDISCGGWHFVTSEVASCITLIANKPAMVRCIALCDCCAEQSRETSLRRVNSRVLMELYHQLERFGSPGGASTQCARTDAVVHMHWTARWWACADLVYQRNILSTQILAAAAVSAAAAAAAAAVDNDDDVDTSTPLQR